MITSKKLYTLAFIQNKENILLGLKKRGIGKGKWNGFGGKVEKGEKFVDTAAREVKEECGIEVSFSPSDQCGLLEFTFEGQSEMMEVHIFKTNIFQGTPVESDEMCPKWYPIRSIPYTKMWPDDEKWYPWMFKGKKFKGRCHFQGEDILLSHTLREVNNIDDLHNDSL